MDQTELANALVELTGSLEPGPDSTAADLETARLALAHALLSGQPIDAIRFAASQSLAAVAALHNATIQRLPGEHLARIDELAANAIHQLQGLGAGSPTTLAYLRTMPVQTDFDPSIPAWAHGMKVLRSLGPFFGPGNLPVWVDVLQTLRLLPCVRGQGNDLFALLPIDTGAAGNTRRHLQLREGSIWIVARLLAASSPNSSFVGLRIKEGSIDCNADLVFSNQVIQIAPDALCILTVTLDPLQAPLPVNGPGADATHAIANLPASVRIEFAPAGAKVTQLPDFDATVYGTMLTLKKTADAPLYALRTQELLIPCAVTPDDFAVADHLSTLFLPEQSAAIVRGAWALPVAITTPDKLAEAAGTGAISIGLGTGIKALWTGLRNAVSFQGTTLHLSPGQLAVFARVKGKSFTQSIALWDEVAAGGQGQPRRSSLDFQYGRLFDVTYVNVPDGEQLLLNGAAIAHLDRPLRADGSRLALQTTTATLALILSPSGQTIVVLGNGLLAEQRPLSLSLENALLLVQAPQSFLLNGSLQDDNTMPGGTLSLSFPLRSILPTLPDPYAANFTLQRALGGDEQLGTLGARVQWSTPEQPELTLALGMDAPDTGNMVHLDRLASDGPTGGIALLDVSSNADQLGVAVLPDGNFGVTIDNLALAAGANTLAIFSVPALSWEPMASIPPDPPPTTPDFLVPMPPDDGGATIVRVPSVHLSPIAPLPLLTQFVSSANTEDARVEAVFSLPLGLRAHIFVDALKKQQGEFSLNQPTFAGSLTGGLQLTLKPPLSERENALFQDHSYTEIVPAPPNPPTAADPGYGIDVLGKDVAGIFNNEFGQLGGVPLRRVDLSGYGASMFSDWRDAGAGVKVIKAQFDVLVGRSSYEVIEVQSYLYPWAVRVVRTVTIERQPAGWILRSDSGWQAATTGEFQYPTSTGGITSNEVHPGPVMGVFNVRRIRDNGVRLPVDKPAGAPTDARVIYQPVLFDAEVKINPDIEVVAGGFKTDPTTTFVPGKDLVGYIQIAKEPASLAPATRLEIAALLQRTGPLGGPLASIINIGQSGVQMRVSGVDVSVAYDLAGKNPVLVATLRGSPLLPRDGAWSMGRQLSNQPAPTQLDPLFPVPLVQNRTEAGLWHLADPLDILHLNVPSTSYGLLQSTGTQKMFFPAPQVKQGQPAITIPQPPSLADVGALLGATGIFPELGKALPFDQPQHLAVNGPDLKLSHDWDLWHAPGSATQKTLLDFKVVQVVLTYQDENGAPTRAHVKIDPGANPRWEFALTRLRFEVIFTPLSSEPLLMIYGKALADANSAPTVTNLNIVYGGLLKPVEEVFSSLQTLAAFLPGGLGAGLDVSFSQGKLTVRDVFAIPQLPLGLGEIDDVSLDLGLSLQLTPQKLDFLAGIGSKEKPFHWVLFPLSGDGFIQVGAQDNNVVLVVQGGLGLGLAIDLGIASGSASIVLSVQVDSSIHPLAFKGILTGQASVDVLDGLASASLTLSAGMGIAPDVVAPPLPLKWPPDPSITLPSEKVTFIASVRVGIHISACWGLAGVNYDDYWQFTQTFTTPAITVGF